MDLSTRQFQSSHPSPIDNDMRVQSPNKSLLSASLCFIKSTNEIENSASLKTENYSQTYKISVKKSHLSHIFMYCHPAKITAFELASSPNSLRKIQIKSYENLRWCFPKNSDECFGSKVPCYLEIKKTTFKMSIILLRNSRA